MVDDLKLPFGDTLNKRHEGGRLMRIIEVTMKSILLYGTVWEELLLFL